MQESSKDITIEGPIPPFCALPRRATPKCVARRRRERSRLESRERESACATPPKTARGHARLQQRLDLRHAAVGRLAVRQHDRDRVALGVRERRAAARAGRRDELQGRVERRARYMILHCIALHCIALHTHARTCRFAWSGVSPRAAGLAAKMVASAPTDEIWYL